MSGRIVGNFLFSDHGGSNFPSEDHICVVANQFVRISTKSLSRTTFNMKIHAYLNMNENVFMQEK